MYLSVDTSLDPPKNSSEANEVRVSSVVQYCGLSSVEAAYCVL